jgi:hypothetical protein
MLRKQPEKNCAGQARTPAAPTRQRDAWVGPSFLTRRDYDASLGWSAFSRERTGAALRCMESYVEKTFDIADIVREAIFRQLRATSSEGPLERHKQMFSSGRVAHPFAAQYNRGCPILRVLCEGWVSRQYALGESYD